MKNAKTVLITGGAGFIATHLCRHLLAQGFKVRSLDLKEPLYRVKGVAYTRGDCRNKTTLTKAIRGVSAVFHFAAITSVPVCQNDPYESYRSNFMMTVDVLEALRIESERSKTNVRLVFAGSSVVYGHLGEKGVSLKEDIALAQPLSFYGSQKLASEQAIRLYVKRFGIKAVVFRFFNLFGHGQDPASPYSGVITKFMSAIKNGTPLNLNGGGNQTRDFIAVEDVARACGLALKLNDTKCNGEAINLGTSTSVTIKDLATIMTSFTKKPCRVTVAPAWPGDVMFSQADITRARDILKWKPQIKLDNGIKRLMENL